MHFFNYIKKWEHTLCYFLRQTMGGDGSNIRLIYIEDEQPLVCSQIAKNECAPCANVPHSTLKGLTLTPLGSG